MTAATDRARSLARIAGVQTDMVKLAEWKLTAAQRRCDALAEERRILDAFVGNDDALGSALARAALRTAKALDRSLAEAENETARLGETMKQLRRRDRAMANMATEAETAARREAEAKTLSETLEAWLARASLP